MGRADDARRERVSRRLTSGIRRPARAETFSSWLGFLSRLRVLAALTVLAASVAPVTVSAAPPVPSTLEVTGVRTLTLTFSEGLVAPDAKELRDLRYAFGATGFYIDGLQLGTVNVPPERTTVSGRTVKLIYYNHAEALPGRAITVFYYARVAEELGVSLRNAGGEKVASFSRTATRPPSGQRPPSGGGPTQPAGGEPVADAGADFEVDPGVSATLDGSASSDPDGDALSFAWSQVSGGTVTLSGAATARATFTAPEEPGDLAFRLTVTDPGGLTGSDEVTVTVRDLAPAFGDAAVGSLVLVLDEAMDPVVLPEATGGNGALSYALTSAPAGLAGLSFNASTRMLSGTPGTEGSLTFTYTAHDEDSNRAESDAAVLTFQVTVDDAHTAEVKRSVRRTLAAVGRRALTSALDNIGARFAASLPMSGLTLAGETVPFSAVAGAADAAPACEAGGISAPGLEQAFGPSGDCAAGVRSRSMEAAEVFRTSGFSVALGAAEGSGTSSMPLWSVWGRGDLGTFAGRPAPGMRYEGELQTGWLGMDARAGPWVAGLALSHGTGEADYSFDVDGASGRGRLETELTALYPYARWTVSDGLELRGVLGAGSGEARHRLGEGPRETSDLSMWMGSLGVRQSLSPLAGIAFAVRGDASLARLETEEGPDDVDGLTADSWRLRTGLEASRRFALDEETAFTPFVEAAARRDGGDGLAGTGLEVVGGVRYTAPRLQVETRGRWLAAHSQEGTRESSVSVTARVGPGAHGRGLLLSLSPRWGSGSAQALWSDELPAASGGDAAAMDARIGYGFGVASDGLLTPFAETGLAGEDSRRLRLGTRFEATHTAFGVEFSGERREGGAGGPEHALRLDLRLRF
ncbi:MAG: autotransporter domain-containing protein [Alphaproteobacteria bacterium]|nr:autotransporter domain-containing protein [Alphaproteobacteria bacterium]